MLKISINAPHLSIPMGMEIELPDLTVLTGSNGSGKSHLLKAIQNSATNSGIPASEVALFDLNAFRLADEQQIISSNVFQHRDAVWSAVRGQVVQNAGVWEEVKRAIPEGYMNLRNRLVAEEGSYNDHVKKLGRMEYEPHVIQALRNSGASSAVISRILTLPFSIDELDRRDFVDYFVPLEFQNSLPSQLGKIVWSYYVRQRKNQFNEYRSAVYGESLPYLSDKVFIEKFGPPPWEVMNKILNKISGLKYQVLSPAGLDESELYQLSLVSTIDEKITIGFADLSSGEKTMLALFGLMFSSSFSGGFPRLMLLDEVDASLHPSMIRSLLTVLKEVLTPNGVKTILVTHSPTTVALAPEEALFEMKRVGPNRLTKIGRSEALSLLTEGFATLDEGLMLYREASMHKLSIFTEGYNAMLVKVALELYEIDGIHVVENMESVTGKNQLRTLFDFFAKTSSKQKIAFLLDCDVTTKLDDFGNVIWLSIERNEANKLASRGIENAFGEHLFDGFVNEIRFSNSSSKFEFDGSRKKDFSTFIAGRKVKEDFLWFEPIAKRLVQLRDKPL